MTKELVSVVLPVFNADPSFLEQSVQSILSQNYTELELIVAFECCNAMIDDSALAVLEEHKDDHRLRLIMIKRRLGLAASLNEGIKVSKGKIIARMDCDDVSLPPRIEEELEEVQKGRADLVGCWARVIDRSTQDLGRLSPPCEWQDVRRNLLFHNPFVHSTILFRKRVVEVAGLYKPEFELTEDYEFYMRAFSVGFRGTNLPKYLQLLREHDSSLLGGNKWKRNRIAYLKCKLSAVFDYGFNRPRDIVFLGITPLAFLLNPKKVLTAKRLVGLYH